MLTIELIAHVDAGNRRLWRGDQDERPLSDLGRRQAEHLTKRLAVEPVDTLFSSPALRCRQTIEPLSKRFGLNIEKLPALAETDGFLPPPGWGKFHRPVEAHGGAYAAGRAYSVLTDIRVNVREGRVAVCSHGDTVPALIAFISAAHSLALPEPPFRPIWYTIQFEGDICHGRLNSIPEDFPGA
jgi:8-oxo-dGTP diphosphatase